MVGQSVCIYINLELCDCQQNKTLKGLLWCFGFHLHQQQLNFRGCSGMQSNGSKNQQHEPSENLPFDHSECLSNPAIADEAEAKPFQLILFKFYSDVSHLLTF